MTKQSISAASRTEINLIRLLSRCETLAAENKSDNEWRLVKYVETLHTYLSDLRKLAANAPSRESLTDYTRRVDLLEGVLAAEKLTSTSDKCLAVESLVSSKQTNTAGNASRDLHHRAKAKYQKDAREELFGTSSDCVVGGGDTDLGREGDVDSLLRHHRQQQERLAENMVQLARNLKENVRMAGHIVKSDKDKLVESSRLADSNYSRLHVESVRLEHHANKACSCWIFVMLIVVVAVFIWMVLFMKMFSKK